MTKSTCIAKRDASAAMQAPTTGQKRRRLLTKQASDVEAKRDATAEPPPSPCPQALADLAPTMLERATQAVVRADQTRRRLPRKQSSDLDRTAITGPPTHTLPASTRAEDFASAAAGQHEGGQLEGGQPDGSQEESKQDIATVATASEAIVPVERSAEGASQHRIAQRAKVAHESTHCTFRVRVGDRSWPSKGFRYKAGGESDKERTEREALEYAARF